MSTKTIYEWSVGDVACWLEENGLSKHKSLLCDKHQIDGNSLMSLTENDLRKHPVKMTVLGNAILFPYIFSVKCFTIQIIKKLFFCISKNVFVNKSVYN